MCLDLLNNEKLSCTAAHYHADTTTSEPFSQSSSEKLEDQVTVIFFFFVIWLCLYNFVHTGVFMFFLQAVAACSKVSKIAGQDKEKVSKKCELKTCERGHLIAVSSSQPPNVSRQQTPSLCATNSLEKDLRFLNSDSRIFKSCSLSCNGSKTCSHNKR